MIIESRDRKIPHASSAVDADEYEGLINAPRPSASPPPAFDTIYPNTGNRCVRFADSNFIVPPRGADPISPDFAPYTAERFETSSGSVVSHDKRLNNDAEALYYFLLCQSRIPPQLFLHIQGHHEESETHCVHRIDDKGHAQLEKETEAIKVNDFDFQIDISQHILHEPTQWTIPDEEPAYRGTIKSEVDDVLTSSRMPTEAPSGQEHARRKRRKASKKEKRRANARKAEITMRGLPPWIGPMSPIGMPPQTRTTRGINSSAVGPSVSVELYQNNAMRSTMTVREWAGEYCASNKIFKEFAYEKVIYGWNFSALETAVVAVVKSTHYNGDLTVKFERRRDKVFIRADNWLCRALSNRFFVILSYVTLLYPFIWLFRRFHQRGGGKWEICGGAYALKALRLVEHGGAGDSNANNQPVNLDAPPPFTSTIDPMVAASGPLDTGRLMNTHLGVAESVGIREGKWFQMWEGTIKRAVVRGLKVQVPLTIPDDGPLPAALILDGYQPRPLVSEF